MYKEKGITRMSKVLKIGKGKKLSLKKSNGGDLKHAEIRLYWVSPEGERFDYDLDATAIQLIRSKDPRYQFGRALGDDYVCFYGQPETQGILSMGDDQEGGDKEGEPNEVIKIDFTDLSPRTELVRILLTIHDADKRRQSFDRVSNARVELVDSDTDEVLVTSDLDSLAPGSTSAMFVVFEKGEDGKFTFENVSQGYKKDVLQMLSVFGIEAEY